MGNKRDIYPGARVRLLYFGGGRASVIDLIPADPPRVTEALVEILIDGENETRFAQLKQIEPLN